MLIVSARIRTKPGRRAVFVKEAQHSIIETRKEAGCLMYELYASTDNGTDVIYIEKWTDRPALDKHLKSAHLIAFDNVKKEMDLVEGDTQLEIFTVAD